MRKAGFITLFALFLLGGHSSGQTKRQVIPRSTQQQKVPQEVLQRRDSTLLKLRASVRTAVDVRLNENGTPALLSGRLTEIAQGDKIQFATSFLEAYRDLFLLKNPREELKVKNSKVDKAGNTHIRFEQFYEGLPVWGAQLLVHFQKDGYIQSVNGNWEPTPQIDVTTTIPKEAALQVARTDLKESKLRREPATQLMIFPWENQTYLAWQITLSRDLAHVWKYFVDAKTGRILLKYNDVKNDGPYSATGIDLHNNPVSLNAYLKTGTIYLIDVTKSMYVPPVDSLKGVIATLDAQNGTLVQNAVFVTDPNGDGVFNDNAGLKAGVSAHYNIGLVYDYFKNKFGRNSWDDNGSSIGNIVHYGVNYDNAFWSPSESVMVFGDGDGVRFSALAGALDVTAHEFAHSITQAASGLLGFGESGALNEHISDFWGAMVDRSNWLIGEDVWTPGIPGDALRDMANPHNSGGGAQPASLSEFLYEPIDEAHDWGEVHSNDGIPNRASYLLASAITRDTAEQLYYQALVYHLFPKAKFVDLRRALLQAAGDIFFNASNYSHIVSSINNSFNSVGVTDLYSQGLDYLAYDDGTASYYYYVGPLGGGYNPRLAVRFTPHAPCSLSSVSAQFFTPGAGAALHIWNDIGGMPGAELLNLPISRTVTYPSWQTINLSTYHFSFDSDFFIGFSSTAPDSFLLSDAKLDSNHFDVYWDTLSNNQWFLVAPTDSNSIWYIGDPLIRATVNYLAPPCPAAKGDLNGINGPTPADAVLMLNCVFLGVATNTIDGKCNLCYTDLNCVGGLTPADAVIEIYYVFLGTPIPCP